MTKFQMLYAIAKDCIDDEYKARTFAFRAKEHKTMEEVKNLYNEWKSHSQDEYYFRVEIIGYTELKRQAYLKRHDS